ncbi:macrophage colony-stimulating factor 1 isoform X1 [Sturnira hondurensis]|uniref:macrophage colony-stimulating factor 1 isoform X1 n=1 Tax=Sturnira hondurensis TaxID=192404 RepID=UPI0018796E26|nr:macrophage colony-stimulating factor 1 isoform X1 [Sturnira hondurensis]XP_036894672.1 macrophage colony-stimulating factor 1 isoform X1 [Sturnira hondurensis]
MTARGAAGRCPTTTWLGRVLLLVYLLVSSSIAKEQSKHCSQMIGDGHLQLLQQLIDSQMETSCKISFMFVDQNLTDQVCYIRKAFLLVQDILEDTISFKGNTSNANALKNIQELSVRLNDCFPKVNDEEQDKACVQNFSESPLWLLEKIKNVFSEMKNLLKDNQDIFSKDCSDSFAECSSQGWLNVRGGSEESTEAPRGVGALLPDPCCEPPGYPGCGSPQDALSVPSRDRLDLKSEHHPNSPNVATQPDCNCLYPKATPSSDPASVSPQQPLAPSSAPLAGLTWAEAEGTEDSSLLPSEQPPRTVDLGSTKQRPPRSTCQSFESPETPGIEGGPTGGSPQTHPPARGPVPGSEDVLDFVLSTDWALEEASGEASEGLGRQGPEPSSSRLGGGRVQAESSRPSDIVLAPPSSGSTKGRLPVDGTRTSLPESGPARPTGQTRSHTPEKTDRPTLPPGDHQAPGSARTPSLRPKGLSRPSTLSAQPRLPSSHTWGSVLPLRELQGKRSARARRSPAGQERGGTHEGAALPHAHFNSVPLTDTGHKQPPTPQPPEPLLPPLASGGGGVILVLLALGGLLFYGWRRRSLREPQRVDSPMERPEGSPLTQDEDRQVDLPV